MINGRSIVLRKGTLILLFSILYITAVFFVFNEIVIRGVLLLFLCAGLYESGGKIRFEDVFIGYLMFAAYFLVSLLWAQGTNNVLYTMAYMVAICGMVVFIPRCLDNTKDVEKYLIFNVVLMAATGILLICVTSPSDWGAARLGVTIGINSNTLGMSMAFTSMYALYFAREKKAKWYYVLVVLFALLALLSGSRKAFLVLLLTIGGLLLLTARGGAKKIAIIILVVVGIMLLYRFVMTNELLYNLLGRRIQHLVNSMTSNEEIVEGSLSIRTYYKKFALDMFLEKPIFGWGAEGFRNRMGLVDKTLQSYSHNNYTELLANHGVVGLLIYYVPLVYLTIRYIVLFKHRKNDLHIVFLLLLLTMFFVDYGAVAYYIPDKWLRIILAQAYLGIESRQLRQDMVTH